MIFKLIVPKFIPLYTYRVKIVIDVDQCEVPSYLTVYRDRTSIPIANAILLEVLLTMSELNTNSGIAALSICESLLLALNDAHALPMMLIPEITK